MPEQCEWKLQTGPFTDDVEFYETSCGYPFELTAGTPEENNMMFCPYCGKIIHETKED